MKKQSFKITKWLKSTLVIASLLTGMHFVHANPKAALAFAPIGLVAQFKKKGITLEGEELAAMETLEEVVNNSLKSATTEAEVKTAVESAITEAKKSLVSGDALKELEGIVVKQAEEITKLKNMGAPSAKVDMSVKGQLKAWMEGKSEKGQSNADLFEQFKKGEINKLTIEIKAATNETVAGSAAAASPMLPNFELQPGYINLVRNQPFVSNYMNGSATSNAAIYWVEKTNPQGQAQFIGEGVLKPLVSFDFKKSLSSAKKVSDKIKVSTEALDDIDFMASAITDELKYLVDIATDTELITGDGTGDNLKGLDAFSGGYVLTTIKTDTPNLADVIKAIATQIKTLNFNANVALVNPIDAANLQLQKGATGYYVIPPFVSANGMEVAGVTVVESNQIAVGTVRVYDSSRTNLRRYKGFTVQYGWVNDDFEKGFVTVIGEQRLHFYVPDNWTGAFVSETIAHVQAAIANAGV